MDLRHLALARLRAVYNELELSEIISAHIFGPRKSAVPPTVSKLSTAVSTLSAAIASPPSMVDQSTTASCTSLITALASLAPLIEIHIAQTDIQQHFYRLLDPLIRTNLLVGPRRGLVHMKLSLGRLHSFKEG